MTRSETWDLFTDRITVTGFTRFNSGIGTGDSTDPSQQIKRAIVDAYNRSDQFKAFIDPFLTKSPMTVLTIAYEKDKDPAFRGSDDTIRMDPKVFGAFVTDPTEWWTFVDKAGVAQRYDLQSVLIHEMTHAISDILDPANDLEDDAWPDPLHLTSDTTSGATVDKHNLFMVDLGKPEQLSYSGQNSTKTDLIAGVDFSVDSDVDTAINLGLRTGAPISRSSAKESIDMGVFEALAGNGPSNDIVLGKEAVTNEIRGGRGDDRLWGRDQADTLDGGLGEDVLIGGGGGDVLKGSFGDDLMIGGEGNDTAVYQGFLTDYDFMPVLNGLGVQIIDKVLTETDTLFQVETARFLDPADQTGSTEIDHDLTQYRKRPA